MIIMMIITITMILIIVIMIMNIHLHIKYIQPGLRPGSFGQKNATGSMGAPVWAALAKVAQPRHLLAAGMLMQAEIWDVDQWIWLKIIDTPNRWFPTQYHHFFGGSFGRPILSHCHVCDLGVLTIQMCLKDNKKSMDVASMFRDCE